MRYLGNRPATAATEPLLRGWISQGNQRRRLHVRGNAEQGLDLALEHRVDGRQRRAESERACRQQEVLHGGIDRRSGQERARPDGLLRNVFVAHKNQDRGISHVEGQMGDRLVDLPRQSGDRLLADACLLTRPAIVVPDLLLRLGVADDDETPWLRVPPTWSADRRLEDALNGLVRHRNVREPADRPLRVHGLEQRYFLRLHSGNKDTTYPPPNDVQSERRTSRNNGETMTVRVTGTVLDERGNGVPWVSISNGEFVVRTDARGRYEIEAEPGSHSFITVSAPDTHRSGGILSPRANDQRDC